MRARRASRVVSLCLLRVTEFAIANKTLCQTFEPVKNYFRGVPLRELVKQFRTEKDLTQAKLAALVGVSEASVNNWERGKNRPTPAALAKMTGLASAALAEKLRAALKDYKWHRGPTGASNARELRLDELPSDISNLIERLLERDERLDTYAIIVRALRTGLAKLFQRRSSEWKALLKDLEHVTRGVEDREYPADSARKHSRSKIA